MERPKDTEGTFTRAELAERIRAIGWTEVLTAGGPIPVTEWAEKPSYRGERFRLDERFRAHEIPPDHECDAAFGVWTFGNFS